MSASGTVGNAITFSTWKGIAYVREYFIPANPQSTEQTNMRYAMTLIVAYWATQTGEQKAAWDAFASGTGMSGFNQFVKRALYAYIIDHGVAVAVTAVSLAGSPPSDVWTWTPAV